MDSYIYRRDRRQIIFRESLAVYQLNWSAARVFELLSDGRSADEISLIFTQELGLSIAQAEYDVDKACRLLSSLGINRFLPFDTDEQWMPKVGIIHVVKNCNSPCFACDCWRTKESTYHSAVKLRSLFIEMARYGATEVMISGGEPTLHPELRQILHDLQDIGLKCRLNTNGLTLDNNEWLWDEDLFMLVVSVDGSNPEEYRKLRGVDAFDRLGTSLRVFKSRSPKTLVTVRHTLTRHSLFHLDRLVEFAKESAINLVSFSPADVDSISFARGEMGKARVRHLIDEMLPSLDELEHFFSSFIPGNSYYDFVHEHADAGILQWGPREIIKCANFYYDQRIGRKGFSRSPCAFPKLSFLLDYDGSLRSCFYSDSFGHIDNLACTDWSLTNRLVSLHESDICTACRGKVFCDV